MFERFLCYTVNALLFMWEIKNSFIIILVNMGRNKFWSKENNDMPNLSQIKREKMLHFLETLKEQHNDDKTLMAIHQIEQEITAKKYGLVWEEHEEEADVKIQTHIPVFTEDREKEIIGDPKCDEYNFLLEGENLYSLKLLEKTHKGKIDLIYIDPPYNTKNKDFVYDDKRIGEEDAYRHSMWISFMEKRIRILKTLMSEKGIIFISIDDNEQANLKILCDSIFGEKNFISMAIHKNNSSKNQAKFLSVSTEYVLIYANNINELKRIFPEKNEGWRVKKKGASDVNKKYLELKKAGFSLAEIEKAIKDMYRIPKYSHLSRWNKVNEHGVFLDADLSRANGSKEYTILNPFTGKDCMIPERGWGKSKEELLRLQEEGLIWYGDPNTPPRMISYITGDDFSVPDSFWYYDNSVDTKLIKKIFGKDVFNNPKPIEMIIHILEMVMYKNETVLDVFAGSGTTAQAVLELNNEDGGNRKFILCTNNENHICEEVTYQRIKTVITGLRADKSCYSEGLPSNLKYYKIDFIEKTSEELHDKLLGHMAEMIQLQYGIKADGEKYVIIMDDDEMDEFEKNFNSYKELKAVFINQDVMMTASQENLLSNINTFSIPDLYFDTELREVGELW
ncbi:MAG: site-specific DNA-methyltransferase [Eubacterium sp.]|nr:site-specific DNA-methyltransferase [Eubacterium sp.]